MRLENQVCSFELAKKLKELGVDQNSDYFWEEPKDKEWAEKYGYSTTLNKNPIKINSYQYYSAFNVAELGEMLPKSLPTKCHHTFDLEIRFTHLGWEIRYEAGCNGAVKKIIYDIFEANVRAKMLIYLIENGNCEIDTVNWSFLRG